MSKKTKKTEGKLPDVSENEHTVILDTDEMLSLIQILTFSKDLFEQMSSDCLKAGDEKSSRTFSARAQLSMMLYMKLKDMVSMGEPTSREMH